MGENKPRTSGKDRQLCQKLFLFNSSSSIQKIKPIYCNEQTKVRGERIEDCNND